MKIILTESQYNKITEAMSPGFRLDYLTSAQSFSERNKYCLKMLGKPIGKGSSRIVYQIDDETCLKLAWNEKGVAQNMEEINIARDGFISYIPKVYNGSDEENGLWIITQYVLPAKAIDFKKVLGILFDDVYSFVYNTDRRFDYKLGQHIMRASDNVIFKLYQKYDNNDAVIELFNDICDLKANYDQFVGDLSCIRNWGLTRENGREYLVMLDTGFSEEVYNQFYKRKII